MNPSPFTLSRPESLGEAVSLLAEHGDSAKLLAGGHSLLPIMKLRLAEPDHLIDISRLPELSGVAVADGTLTIGALTTHHEVATNETIARMAPLLAATAARIGDQQVRNRGTIGGALAHADAASDYPAAVLALDATIIAHGKEGERKIPAREFFIDFLTTALSPDEVITGLSIDSATSQLGWNYQKLANQASGYAIVGVAAIVDVEPSGTISDIRIGVTGAAAVPWRAAEAESALRGQTLTDDTLRRALERSVEGIELLDDLHGSAEYRRRVTQGLLARAIREAAARLR